MKPSVRRVLKVFVTVFGIIFVTNFMGWELKGVLAGLGIGGLACAFAGRRSRCQSMLGLRPRADVGRVDLRFAN